MSRFPIETLKRDELFQTTPLPEGVVMIGCLNLTLVPPSFVDIYWSLLAEDERNRADRFAFPSLRAKYVLSRGILRTLLGRLLGLKAQALNFSYGEAGKPFLPSGPHSLEFNLSHSGEMVAYAFTKCGLVGIDIEQRRELRDLEGIAERFFGPVEYQELMSLDPTSQQLAFFNCWTRKEAYIKAVGGGLSIPLDSFRVSLLSGQAAALLALENDCNEARQWIMLD